MRSGSFPYFFSGGEFGSYLLRHHYCGAIKFVRHPDLISTLPANFRLRKARAEAPILDTRAAQMLETGEEVKKGGLA